MQPHLNKRFEWKELPDMQFFRSEIDRHAKDITIGETLFFKEHGVKTKDSPGTMTFGNTIDYGLDISKNYGALASFSLADAKGSHRSPHRDRHRRSSGLQRLWKGAP